MLLIDAFNVIGARWVLPATLRPHSVPSLLGLVARSRYARRRIRVVCDGTPGPEWRGAGILETTFGQLWTRVGRAEVVFSGKGIEADDVIEEILAERGGLSILMVSSDRRLIRAAGRAGADQIGNGTFLRQLRADLDESEEEPPAMIADVPLDRHAVEGWMREFGYEPPERAAAERTSEPTGKPKPSPSEPPRPEPSRNRPRKKADAGEFGQRLQIPPIDPGPAPEPEPSPPAGRQADADTPAGSGPSEAEPLDPILARAFEEWRGRLSADDLDMSRWITGVEPIRGKRGNGRR